MSFPRKSPSTGGCALLLAVVATGCVQREVRQIPGPDLLSPSERAIAAAPILSPGAPGTARSGFAAPPRRAESVTLASLDTRILVPIELRPGDLGEWAGAEFEPLPEPLEEPPDGRAAEPPNEPLVAIALESTSEPETEVANEPLVALLPASPEEEPPRIEAPAPAPHTPRLVDLHGRIHSRTTGQPLQWETPLVVLAFPDEGSRNESAPRPTREPALVARDDRGFSPTYAVTSPERGVRFENHDAICHSFFSSSEPNAFEPGMLSPGESRDVYLQHPGLVQVYCSLHAGKQLSVLVVPTPYHALVAADGSFVLEDLEPGNYQLETRGDNLALHRLRVHVTGGGMQPLLFHIDPEPAKGAE